MRCEFLFSILTVVWRGTGTGTQVNKGGRCAEEGRARCESSARCKMIRNVNFLMTVGP